MLPGQEIAATEPLQPIKSGRSRKTPQPELLPQRSSRRTPKLEKTQLDRSTRKTPTTRVIKKRGRPAKKTSNDHLDNASTSHISPAGGESIPTKKRKPGRAQKEKDDAMMMADLELQSDGIRKIETASTTAPSTGIKKRKKRKSIGQQSTSRAKAAKTKSPLKRARQPRNRISKPSLAEVTEATDLDGALANELQKGPSVEPSRLDRGEPTSLAEVAEVAEVFVSGVDSVGPGAQRPKKRKRVAVDQAPKKRIKTSSTGIERAPKVTKTPKTYNEVISTTDALAANQSMEQPTEVEAGSSRHVHDEPNAAVDVAKPRNGKLMKEKRVPVDQKPKKRVKAGITPTNRERNTQGGTGTAESEIGVRRRGGKPDEVEPGSMAHLPEEQEATAEAEAEAEPPTQNSKPKRKKRKSIGQQKPKKKSVDRATPNRSASKAAAAQSMATKHRRENKPIAKRGRPRAKQPPEEVIEDPQVETLGYSFEEEATQPSEPRLNTKSKASSRRPKAKAISEDLVTEPDEDVSRHAAKEKKEVHPPVLPEKKKRGRPRKADAAQTNPRTIKPTKTPTFRKPKSKPATTAPKPRAPPKNTIPITIHALPSPTSSSAEDDPLSTTHPHPTTTNTTNAVDVLSQLCSEVLTKHSSSITEQIARSDDPSSSTEELKRTKQTTDLYAQELASRLLQLTTTLNANTSSQSRARAATKDERGLKKELKRLEREREDVRGRKEEAVKEKKRRELEELLGGIAGAVKRGWDMQKDGEEGDAAAGEVERMDLEV